MDRLNEGDTRGKRQIILSKLDSSGPSFEKLLSALDSDPKVAENNYVDIQNRLMMKFEQRRCRDSYVLAVETLKRVERALWEGVIITKNIHAFIHAVGNNVLKEYWKSQGFREDGMGERIELADKRASQNEWELDEEQITREARIDCLEKCLAELAPETRALFEEYYDDSHGKRKHSRREITTRLGLNVNALRQRLQRIRKELHHCISGCVQTRISQR